MLKIVTVKILVDVGADTPQNLADASATDGLNETFRDLERNGFIVDWAYEGDPEHYADQYPHDYEEGDFLVENA